MADKLDETELRALVASEIRSAITYDSSELSKKRADALEYYQGEMRDVPAMPGRSSVVSHDLADTIGWILPGVVRVFTASDEFGVFEPTRPNDEDGAKQATDYCNYVFWKDNHGYRVLYNGTHDSLLHGNGIGKIWWDDSEDCEYSEHSRLTEEQIALLQQEEGVEILAASQNEEPDQVMMPDPATGQMAPVQVPTFDIKIKRVNSRGRVRIITIAPEDFLKDKDAVCIDDDWRFLAHRDAKTRSELVEMGFSKSVVEGLPSDGLSVFSEESIARDEDRIDFQGTQDKSQDLVELYECYIKADADGDGISETVRVYYAGNAGGGEVLDWEVCDDDHPFFDIPCEPIPHRWDARSVADNTMDIQRIKTVLMRQMLDNFYASNLPLPIVEEGAIKNMDALINPQFGNPIIVKKGSAINWQEVPNVAADSLEAIRFLDEVTEKRTGVSRTMMALDPEALQNQTATASQNQRDASYSKIELVARNQAELGWRIMFKKMLRLIVKRQDRPRTIRLRDQWVEIDPRHWNANMDVTINVGLGTGSRDRDMMMLQQVLQTQKGLVDYFSVAGLQKEALEMVPKVINTSRKIAESAGIKAVDSFYPDITEEWVAQKLEEMANAPQQEDPKLAIERFKAEANVAKEQAQFEADIQTNNQEAEIKREEIGAKYAFEDRKLQMEMVMRDREMAQQRELELLKLGVQDKGDGKVVSKSDEQNEVMAAAMEKLLQAVNSLQVSQNAPRRVVRDPQTGRAIGVETVVN